MSEPVDSRSVAAGGYVLGHAVSELERLQTQARLVDSHTRQLFVDAGIERGMRVLDVGSGAGDVAFLVASLVGPTGSVLGVDRSATAIAVATERLGAQSISNVSFRAIDPFVADLDETFDAAVGRYVLQFQPDPVSALRAIVSHVRPGGLVAFHEIDWGGVESFPPAAPFDDVCGWIRRVLAATRTETRMGIKLYATFLDAGLAKPYVVRRSLIGAGDDAAAIVGLIADLAHTLRSEIIEHGIASQELFESVTSALTVVAGERGTVFVAHGQYGVFASVR